MFHQLWRTRRIAPQRLCRRGPRQRLRPLPAAPRCGLRWGVCGFASLWAGCVFLLAGLHLPLPITDLNISSCSCGCLDLIFFWKGSSFPPFFSTGISLPFQFVEVLHIHLCHLGYSFFPTCIIYLLILFFTYFPIWKFYFYVKICLSSIFNRFYIF